MSATTTAPSQPAEGLDTLPTILVVDDYVVDRKIAGGIIERFAKLKVAYAGNGHEAMELIQKQPFAAVLTDLQMPGMDGLALVQHIRERFPRLPVILMTAYGSEEVAIQALRAGASNYVSKKGLARELVDTLRQVLAVAAVDQCRDRVMNSLTRRESQFIIENDPSLMAPLIQHLQEDLGGMEVCDATARMRVGVALQEAISNALYHGNLEVSSDLREEDEREFYGLAEKRRHLDPFRDRKLTIDARFERGEATYRIRDQGPGFDVSKLDRPIEPSDIMRVGGRGMLLIRTFMDQVAHNATGNEITMIKRRA